MRAVLIEIVKIVDEVDIESRESGWLPRKCSPEFLL